MLFLFLSLTFAYYSFLSLSLSLSLRHQWETWTRLDTRRRQEKAEQERIRGLCEENRDFLRAAFDKFDFDDSGTIDAKELQYLMKVRQGQLAETKNERKRKVHPATSTRQREREERERERQVDKERESEKLTLQPQRGREKERERERERQVEEDKEREQPTHPATSTRKETKRPRQYSPCNLNTVSTLSLTSQDELCEPFTKKDVESLLKSIDVNEDGVIDFEEFLKWFSCQFNPSKDTSRVSNLLRMRLRSKKTAREGKRRLKETANRVKEGMDKATPSFLKKTNFVPGQESNKCRVISIDDYQQKLPLFVRWVKQEYSLDFVREDDLVERNARRAFLDSFVPVWNSGKLSKVFYNDGREFEFPEGSGRVWRQVYVEERKRFKYVALDTGEERGANPMLLQTMEKQINKAFRKFDTDRSGAISMAEFQRMVKDELCLPFTEGELKAAFTDMDADGSGEIDYQEFQTWFVVIP